MSAKKQMSV